MVKKLDREPYKAIKWVLKISTLTIFVVVGLLCSNLAWAGVDENFDSYSPGDLSGQGDWETGGVSCLVSDGQFFTSPNSAKTLSSANCNNFKDFSAEVSGSQRFYFYQSSSSANYNGFTFRIRESATDKITFSAYKKSAVLGEIWLSGIGGSNKDYDLDVWNEVLVEWQFPNQVRYNLNDSGFTSWFSAGVSWTALDRVYFANWQNAGWTFDIYFDELGYPPVGFQFDVISPANESTIEDLENEITFSWSGWDFEDIYEAFVFWFVREGTGVSTNLIIYYPSSEAGEIAYPFSDFEFEKNGYYFLKARRADGTFGEELIYPDYWIMIDVEGFSEAFSMLDFETWYAENVDRFASSTPVFLAISGVISPIFSQIGDFGFDTLGFLDTDEALSTGVNLGKYIPLYRGYIEEIEYFFGGFPLIQIFILLVLLLVGIFIFRLILKFIPGLG